MTEHSREVKERDADLAALCEVVARRYDISIKSFRSLGGELDTNVWVQDVTGQEFTIKRSRCGDPNEIRWQYRILDHLSSRLGMVQVPTVIRTTDGERDIVSRHGEGFDVVRLCRWVAGSVVGELRQPSLHTLHQWGTLAADVILALSDVPAQEVPGTHHWDLRRSIEVIEECKHFVENPAHLEAVERMLSRGNGAIDELRASPHQVVHQDLNDFNVLVSGNSDDASVCGLLDVGDALFAPRLAEVAVACAYGMLRQPDPRAAFDAILGGYTSVIPVSADEREMLLELASLRLCVNATTWTKRAKLEGTEYGHRRMAATWPAILAMVA